MLLTDKEREAIFVMVVLAIVGIVYVLSIKHEIDRSVLIEQEVAEYQASIAPFMDLALRAEAFAIYDMDAGQFVYKKHGEESLPLASLAKVMSAIVIMEHVPADHVFTISKDSLSEAGDNKLLVDEKWKRDDLLAFTLVESSNDAILEMASETGMMIDPTSTDPVATFVDAMNAKAREMNLTSLEFSNPSGLDLPDGQTGGYGNARNMAKLFSFAISTYPSIFSSTVLPAPVFHSFDAEHVAKNTNPYVSDIPGLLASKTGFTNIAGGNLVVAVKAADGKRLVMVVMGSTFEERFTDIETLNGAAQNPQAGLGAVVE